MEELNLVCMKVRICYKFHMRLSHCSIKRETQVSNGHSGETTKPETNISYPPRNPFRHQEKLRGHPHKNPRNIALHKQGRDFLFLSLGSPSPLNSSGRGGLRVVCGGSSQAAKLKFKAPAPPLPSGAPVVAAAAKRNAPPLFLFSFSLLSPLGKRKGGVERGGRKKGGMRKKR